MTYYTYILTNWNNKVMYYCESMTDVKAAIAREKQLRKYRTMLMVHERLNFSRLLSADFLTCRQQACEICSLQSTKIHLVTARLDYAVFP